MPTCFSHDFFAEIPHVGFRHISNFLLMSNATLVIFCWYFCSHLEIFFLTCILAHFVSFSFIMIRKEKYALKDVLRFNLILISIFISSFNFVYQWHIPWRCHACLMWTFFWWSHAEESHWNGKLDSLCYISALKNESPLLNKVVFLHQNVNI